MTKKTGTTNSTRLRWNSGCSYFKNTIPYLEFEIELESNNLTFEREYSKKQDVLYQLIKYLHDEKGFGYRKISHKLNSWGIKTLRGKKWFNTSVYSVLKRRKQREFRIENQRNKRYPVEISKLKLKHTRSD